MEKLRTIELQGVSADRPRLAVPVGDPAGIGPEVVLQALAHPIWQKQAAITLVGDPDWLTAVADRLRQHQAAVADPTAFNIQTGPIDRDRLRQVQPGQPSAFTGEVSFVWLETAIAGALAGEFEGIVTAPIAKSLWHAAGHPYPGQTEVLATHAQVDRFGMLFAARSPHTQWQLRTLLATTHIPLHQVPQTLSADLLTSKLALLVRCLRQDFGLSHPHIAISGLNPHSGEAGRLGTEERDWLIPWIQTQRSRHPQITLTGPVPPDTLWVSAGQAWYQNASASPYDAYLALYHDQGLIPVKLLAFDRAVNTTIGLPFVRTSPDHGTAFDIAGRGIAHPDSMVAALELAIELIQQRRASQPSSSPAP